MTDLFCIDVARSALGNPLRQVGQELCYRCPNPKHNDHHPSLLINQRKNVFMCGPCGVAGNAWQLAAFIGNLDPADKAGVCSWLKTKGLLDRRNRSAWRRVGEYLYRDSSGRVAYRVIRKHRETIDCCYEKTFLVEHPRGGGWAPGLGGVTPTVFNLPAVLAASSVVICEGEKDALAASALGLVGTTSPFGAGKWKPEFAEYFRGKDTTIIEDGDLPGERHAKDVARSLVGVAASVKIIRFPNAHDLSDWCAHHGGRDKFVALCGAAPEVTSSTVAEWAPTPVLAARDSDLWTAESMETFLGDENEDPEPFFERILFPETVTEIFSPRGIGKSLFALFLGVTLALKGFRVLLLDRDNPRRTVKSRLSAWGANPELKTLKVITREKCPSLTNAAAWAEFPYGDYDIVVLDSLDSMAEGVGEQDSSKPSRAIAPLLDIARRQGGPAVLVLGNCVKAGTHSRGSGVVEDRADFVFEVRDATGFQPSGKLPWFEELPPADAASWAGRSVRRKRKEVFRLAFIPTKFRIGEEPEPFAMEIDTTTQPWTMREVTTEIDREGQEERQLQLQVVSAAADMLRTEITRRESSGEADLLKKQAEAFLTSRGVRQKVAREAINSPAFEAVDVVGRGHPKLVRLAGANDRFDRNGALTEVPIYAAFCGTDFGQPHEQRATENGPQETQCLGGRQEGTISSNDAGFAPVQLPANSQSEPIRSPKMEAQGIEEEL